MTFLRPQRRNAILKWTFKEFMIYFWFKTLLYPQTIKCRLKCPGPNPSDTHLSQLRNATPLLCLLRIPNLPHILQYSSRYFCIFGEHSVDRIIPSVAKQCPSLFCSHREAFNVQTSKHWRICLIHNSD